jgi:hypothetical protein
MQFARLNSSQLIENTGTSVIDEPTLAAYDQAVFVNESQVRRPKETAWTATFK